MPITTMLSLCPRRLPCDGGCCIDGDGSCDGDCCSNGDSNCNGDGGSCEVGGVETVEDV